jgi:hypothetical protein
VPHWPKGFRCSFPTGTSGDIFRCVIPHDEAMKLVYVEGMRRASTACWLLSCLQACKQFQGKLRERVRKGEEVVWSCVC